MQQLRERGKRGGPERARPSTRGTGGRGSRPASATSPSRCRWWSDSSSASAAGPPDASSTARVRRTARSRAVRRRGPGPARPAPRRHPVRGRGARGAAPGGRGRGSIPAGQQVSRRPSNGRPQAPVSGRGDAERRDPEGSRRPMLWCACGSCACRSAQALPRMRLRLVPHTGQTAFAIRVPLSFTLTSPLGLALLLALHAVELAAPGLRHDGLLRYRYGRRGGRLREVPAGVVSFSNHADPSHAQPRLTQAGSLRAGVSAHCASNLRPCRTRRPHARHLRSTARPTASRVLVLDNPDQRNAMSDEMTASWVAAIDELAADRSLRVVVVTGAGTAFCSGGNTGWIASEPDAEVDRLRTRMIAFYRAWLSIRRLEVPTIAAVNGPAIGAGLCLALACDIRYAAAGGQARRPVREAGHAPRDGGDLPAARRGRRGQRPRAAAHRPHRRRRRRRCGSGWSRAVHPRRDVPRRRARDRGRASRPRRRSRAATRRSRCATAATGTSSRRSSGRRSRSRSRWPPRTSRRGSAPRTRGVRRTSAGSERPARKWQGPRCDTAVCLPLANVGDAAGGPITLNARGAGHTGSMWGGPGRPYGAARVCPPPVDNSVDSVWTTQSGLWTTTHSSISASPVWGVSGLHNSPFGPCQEPFRAARC